MIEMKLMTIICRLWRSTCFAFGPLPADLSGGGGHEAEHSDQHPDGHYGQSPETGG